MSSTERQLTEFVKHSYGKAPLALWRDFPLARAEIAKVLQFGAEKYSRGNWRKCEDLDEYYSASERHLDLCYNGETYAPDSSLHHVAHAITSLLFILEKSLESRGVDPKNEE